MATDSQQIFRALEVHQEKIRALGAQRLGLFGSHARGDATDASDLDFLVEFKPGAKSFDNYMDLKFLLEELFGRRVDLVLSTVLKPRLRDRILRETIYVPGL
jgi:predicted nucleotidyltransferase